MRKWAGGLLTDLEYRLRVSRPFTHGSGAPRVFYPGCSLTAADPALVMRAYKWLRARDPTVVLWSDCCGMPLEKFSSPRAAERGRDRTRRLLRESGTTEIITACGNCTVQFQRLGVDGLRLTSLYGLLAEEDWGPRPSVAPTVVHHPCSARTDKSQQTHFRRLADRLHLDVVNAGDAKHQLSCCLIESPAAKAKRAALADKQLITYCAHCTMGFQKDIPTRHVLQEIFGAPDERWAPQGKVARFGRYRSFARMASGAPRREPRWALGAVLAVLAATVIVLLARHGDLARRALQLVSWSRDAGAFGALVYGVAYVLSAVLLLPGSVLTLGAGFAWGPVLGVIIVSPVSVLAATAAFVLGRTLLRARVERRIGRDPRLRAIDRAIAEHGMKLVLLLRLSPVLPFNALNYALALTRVRLRDYVIGSALGMFPATVLYVYLGTLVTSGSELLAGKRSAAGTPGMVLYWGGLLATVLVVVQITRIARAELDRLLAQPDT
ncbi:MAG: TVP38/TMEM64 family protein [Deltaproteobacteria bacterium]|nr:TVP38/TMEM64 family protein [Deltaproteobacteria bacterium]